MPVAGYLLSFFVVGMSLSVLGPALSELRDRAGTDLGGIGVLFVGQACGYIVGSLLAGRMFDLKPADGAIGAHAQAVGRCRDDFTALAKRLTDRLDAASP